MSSTYVEQPVDWGWDRISSPHKDCPLRPQWQQQQQQATATATTSRIQNMSQLTFQACIFNGAICSACRVALDNTQYFGVQTLVQASNRGGRDGTRSRSIFLHSENRWNCELGKENVGFRVQAFKSHGVNADNPEIFRHLSVGSMNGYLAPKKNRLASLRMAMDDVPQNVAVP